MAHIQLAPSVAYLGQLRETGGCGRVMGMHSFPPVLPFLFSRFFFFVVFFFFKFKSMYNKLYVLKAMGSDSQCTSHFILLTLGNSDITFLRIKGKI